VLTTVAAWLTLMALDARAKAPAQPSSEP
jgi:hypothetical protein